MKTYKSLVGGLLITMLSSVTQADGHVADRVLVGGVVYTADAMDRVKQAVAIRDGEILYVGSDTGVEPYISDETDIIELDGRMVMPGIHDSHIHALEGGSEVGGNCALPSSESVAGYADEIRRCAGLRLGTDWVLAYGHDLETLLETADSPVALLDKWVPDRPVAVMEQSSHSAWVNSMALKLAGIDASTPDPAGGVILRDERGRPTGVLLETAAEHVFELSQQPNPEAAEINYQGLMYTLDEVAANGITSFSDARVYWQRGWLEVWKRADKEDRLNARVNLGLWAYPEMNDAQQIKVLKNMYRQSPDSLLQINQIKLYSDGIIHNTTAALKSPYKQSVDPAIPSKGLNYFTQQRMQRYVSELGSAGFDFHIHAIGDRGVHESLNAIEQAQQQGGQYDRRHRLTHVEMVADQDLPRFAELNVIADMQVAGVFTLPGYEHWQTPYIGKRAYNTFRLKDLYDSGAHVVLSSDWTVSPMSPFLGIQHALQRGKQSISLTQALRAYTINAAYLMRQEQLTGSLEVGKAADLIVLDRNLFETSVNNIKRTKVLLTLLEGEETWRAEGF